MKQEYADLYEMMARSNKVEYMHTFGSVLTTAMDWMIVNRPEIAQEMIDKLESIRWKNYLTPKEAERIVANMNPKAPWSREQWKQAMEQHGYDLEQEPCYNRCALWVTMNMIMSDSSETLSKYVDNGKIFDLVHSLAVDKLKDADKVFSIREYFHI